MALPKPPPFSPALSRLIKRRMKMFRQLTGVVPPYLSGQPQVDDTEPRLARLVWLEQQREKMK